MARTSEVVVITGASAGVGRATAHQFARRCARVALIARESPALQGALAEVQALGAKCLAIGLDVADAAAVDQAADRIERELGPIDTWINAAMVTVFSPVSKMTADEYRRAMEVTYLGTVHGTLAALRCMRARRRGHIVQVGSALAYRAIPLQSAYCAAKFAIRGFSDALRVELLHERSRIHVTMVQLSAFNTPQFDWARNHLDRRSQPVPPIFQPELAARAIYWSAHHRRREICVGFPAWKAIFFNRWAPGLADRYLALTGYQAQIEQGTTIEGQPDNLDEAVPADFGTHGRFDSRARTDSWHWWLTRHRDLLWLAAACATASLAWHGRRKRES